VVLNLVDKGSNFDIKDNKKVKVKKMNHIIEIMYVEKKSNALTDYIKINKDEMIKISTGEVIKIKHNNTRDEVDIKNLRRTIQNIRDLINMNFKGEKNELFITLTYKENMKDLKRLYKDYEKFYKKLKWKYREIEFLYISVVEPQERGAWHIHLLLKALNKDYLYIENKEIERMWNKGFTKTEGLQKIDNIGAYISSYLINIKDGEKTKKGQRLKLYPVGMNIYRYSKNCKVPFVIEKEYGEVKKELKKENKTYEVTYEIKNEEGKIINVIKKEYYNLKRL
jgi:hypothetical protein